MTVSCSVLGAKLVREPNAVSRDSADVPLLALVCGRSGISEGQIMATSDVLVETARVAKLS